MVVIGANDDSSDAEVIKINDNDLDGIITIIWLCGFKLMRYFLMEYGSV